MAGCSWQVGVGNAVAWGASGGVMPVAPALQFTAGQRARAKYGQKGWGRRGSRRYGVAASSHATTENRRARTSSQYRLPSSRHYRRRYHLRLVTVYAALLRAREIVERQAQVDRHAYASTSHQIVIVARRHR